MTRSRIVTSAVCALLFACSASKKQPATEVIVAITSDLTPQSELSRIEIGLSKRDGSDVVAMQDFALVDVDAKPKAGQQRLPITFSIGRGAEPTFLLTVRGYGPFGADGAEQEIVEQKAIATFQTHKSLLLQIFLGRVCLGNLCGGDAMQVCYTADVGLKKAGECGAISERLSADSLRALDRSKLPDLSRPPPDVVVLDATVGADAGLDAATPREDAGSGGSSGMDGHMPEPDAGAIGGSGGSMSGSGGSGGSSAIGTCELGKSELESCTLGP